MFLIFESSAFASAICEFICDVLAAASSCLLFSWLFSTHEKPEYTASKINKPPADLSKFLSTVSNFCPKSNVNNPFCLFLSFPFVLFDPPTSIFSQSGNLSANVEPLKFIEVNPCPSPNKASEIAEFTSI